MERVCMFLYENLSIYNHNIRHWQRYFFLPLQILIVFLLTLWWQNHIRQELKIQAAEI